MSDPVLHILAGPNGSGKSTLYARVLGPTTGLPFVNADVIAVSRWPGETAERSYEAAREASAQRGELLAARRSFVTETVFSHPSKVDLVSDAAAAGYIVVLHVLVLPEELAVARVADRVRRGGHPVPEDKVRQRFHRLWGFVASAIDVASEATAYDNARADTPLRPVAGWRHARLVWSDWPTWTPDELRRAGR